MKTTITDVAREAGVSMKTVSRVLNNEPNVAQATRDRVREVAEALQYSPNLAARGLASSRSYLLALIYDNPSPSYITNLKGGAIEACRKRGYHLVIEPITSEQLASKDAESMLSRMNVDGVILTPPLSDDLALRDTLKRLNIRYVLVAPEKPGRAPTVLIDDVLAAEQMTAFLLGQGHARIGFITGHPDHSSTRHRLDGYKRALRARGIDYDAELVASGDFSFRSGVEAAERLLADPKNRPSAIFASNDDMAAAVVSVAGRMGISVPGDLSVCGFDDTPLAQILWPKLTTVAQPIGEMGRKAAEILTDREATGPAVHTLGFELVIRESTRPPIK